MKSLVLLSLLFAAPLWAQPASQPVQAPEPASQPVKAAGSQPVKAAASQPAKTLQGVLSFKEIPPVKSVEAYEGVEFRVDGQPVAPSEHVSREALLALQGKAVEVVCVMQEAAKPNPNESHPVGAGGEPAPRPAKCVIHAIKPR